jgi:hypothetical protein
MIPRNPIVIESNLAPVAPTHDNAFTAQLKADSPTIARQHSKDGNLSALGSTQNVHIQARSVDHDGLLKAVLFVLSQTFSLRIPRHERLNIASVTPNDKGVDGSKSDAHPMTVTPPRGNRHQTNGNKRT